MQDIAKIIVELLIENDEKVQKLKADNAEMSKKLDAVWSQHEGECECGCGKYYYSGHTMPSGYWCSTCNKSLSWHHRDDLTGDCCMICGKMQYD